MQPFIFTFFVLTSALTLVLCNGGSGGSPGLPGLPGGFGGLGGQPGAPGLPGGLFSLATSGQADWINLLLRQYLEEESKLALGKKRGQVGSLYYPSEYYPFYFPMYFPFYYGAGGAGGGFGGGRGGAPGMPGQPGY